MVMKVVNLTCFTHICRRIAETSGFKDFTFLAPHLSLKKSNDSDCIGIEIPLKHLSSVFKVNDATEILKIKNDEVIHRVYESPAQVGITFDIKKEELIKSVLNSHLKSLSTDESHQTNKPVLVEFRYLIYLCIFSQRYINMFVCFYDSMFYFLVLQILLNHFMLDI